MNVLKKLRAALATSAPRDAPTQPPAGAAGNTVAGSAGETTAGTASRNRGPAAGPASTKVRGDAAEALALEYLRAQGLVLEARNYRTPGRGGGEIDLVLRAADGTLVFVEVRQRAGAGHGGAGASIDAAKQRRIVLAARHYLMRFAAPPACRFDVVLVEGSRIEWLPAAFDAG